MNLDCILHHTAKKTDKKCSPTGIAHIEANFSNTKINVTTLGGDTVAWTSGGTLQKGTRKPSAAVAEEIAQKLGKKLFEMGMKEILVRLKGMGNGRDKAVLGLALGTGAGPVCARYYSVYRWVKGFHSCRQNVSEEIQKIFFLVAGAAEYVALVMLLTHTFCVLTKISQ